MNERISKIAQETDAWCDQHYSGEDSYDIEWEKSSPSYWCLTFSTN
jgi:hypothetical protein